jgi:hypothetical protein
VTHTDRIEAHILKCPYVLEICRESLERRIEPDSTYCVQRTTTINRLHTKIHGVKIQGIAHEEIAAAETDTRPAFWFLLIGCGRSVGETNREDGKIGKYGRCGYHNLHLSRGDFDSSFIWLIHVTGERKTKNMIWSLLIIYECLIAENNSFHMKVFEV